MPKQPWRAVASLVVAAVVLSSTALLLRRWPILDPRTRSEVIARLSGASGLSVGTAGEMTVRLAPRPAIEIDGLSMQGLDGAVALDIGTFEGRLDLVSLLHGALRVFAASFDRPTVMIDVDRVAPVLASILAGPAGPSERFEMLHTEGLTLRSGVVRLVSNDPRRDTLVTDLSATLTWPSDGGAATLGGTAAWRGVMGDFAIAIDAPARLAVVSGAPTLLRLRSSVIDLDFGGAVSDGDGFQAKGRLAASTRDLPAFLRAIGTPAPQLGGFRIASVSGDAVVAADRLSISDVALGLDGMRFEGALAVHAKAGRPGLAGTFATDSIELDPFLRALPDFWGADGGWSTALLSTASVATDDIDLRISASKATIDGLRFDDGSLSLQSGNGRMELSLGEAHAYDGLLKGRLVATLDGEATDLRADLSLSRFDLRKLSKDLFRSRVLGGTATGHLSLEAHGASPAAIIGSLAGRGQVSVRDGAVFRPARGWVEVAPFADEQAASWPSDPRTFESASADVAVTHGTAALNEGWILWPDARAVLTGSASLLHQNMDLRAKLGRISDDPDVEPGAPVGLLTLSGPWSGLRLAPAADVGPTAQGR